MEGTKEEEGLGPLQEGAEASELAVDLLPSVFKHLPRDALLAAGSTCKLWHAVASEDTLWEGLWQADLSRSHCSQMSSNEMGGCALSVRNESSEAQAVKARKLLGPSSGGGGVDTSWRSVYKRTLEVDKNWERGRSSARTLHGHNDFIRVLQLAGDTLVSAAGSISHVDCTIRVWDTNSGACKQVLRGHMGPIWCMAYDAGSNRIASGSDDYTVRWWDAASGNSVALQDPDSAVRCIHIDPANRQLVAGTEFGRLLLWNMDSLDELLAAGIERVRQEFEKLVQSGAQAEAAAAQRLLQQQGAPGSSSSSSAAAMPGGVAGAAAAQRQQGPLRYRGQTTQEMMDSRRVVVDGTNHVSCVDAAEEGKAISAIQVQDGLCASTSIEPLSRIQLWDVSGWAWVQRATVGDADMMFANSLSFDKGLGRMVAGCGDKNMRVWDLETNERLFLLNGHIDEIAAHQFDATRLASAALNGHVRLWDMRSGKSTAVLEHDAPVHAFQFEGDRLVSGTWDGRVCLWDLRRNALVQEWETHNERVWAVAMDRFRLVSAGLDHALTVRSFAPEDVAFHGWGGAGGGATGCGGAGGGAGGGASGGTGEGGSRAAEAPAP